MVSKNMIRFFETVDTLFTKKVLGHLGGKKKEIKKLGKLTKLFWDLERFGRANQQIFKNGKNIFYRAIPLPLKTTYGNQRVKHQALCSSKKYGLHSLSGELEHTYMPLSPSADTHEHTQSQPQLYLSELESPPSSWLLSPDLAVSRPGAPHEYSIVLPPSHVSSPPPSGGHP